MTQKLKDVKSNGLPESDYNESLFGFDGEMCKLFDSKDGGLIFLIETFAGKRHYHYFISDLADYEKRMEKIKRDNPNIDIETHSYADKDWDLINQPENGQLRIRSI